VKRIWQFALLCLLLSALLVSPSFACQSLNRQGVLNLWDTGPLTLDPAISADMSSHIYITQIFSGLVRLDDELNIVPDIAESLPEESPDGKTFTFHLRQGVKFQNGREVKAADFKYSWERACDPATGSTTAATYLGDIVGAEDMLAGRTQGISGVEVLDDYTLRVTIDAPKAYFLDKLAYPTAFVVDRANVESGQYWWRQPDGTGPFKLKEWTPEQRLVLERSQIYYGEPAKLEQIVYLLSGESMGRYEKGETDVTLVSTSYIDEASDEASPLHLQLAITPELSLYYIGFNTAKPPFDDVNIRRAFCLAVDKQHIVKVILRDMVSEADGILPPGMPGYNESVAGLTYDLEKAKELIAASKYKDASNLPPITLTSGGSGNSIPAYLGAIIQDWQQNLGVNVTVRQLEMEDFLYNLNEEKDEMFMLGWIADYPDPHNFLDILFHTGSENNVFEYSSPSLDALLDQAAIEQNRAVRLALYQQAEQMVVDDAPCLPLFHGANYILVKPYVKNYELNTLGIPDLSKVYIENG
jgi:oligopeptide transport system substrate-binding protein